MQLGGYCACRNSTLSQLLRRFSLECRLGMTGATSAFTGFESSMLNSALPELPSFQTFGSCLTLIHTHCKVGSLKHSQANCLPSAHVNCSAGMRSDGRHLCLPLLQRRERQTFRKPGIKQFTTQALLQRISKSYRAARRKQRGHNVRSLISLLEQAVPVRAW